MGCFLFSLLMMKQHLSLYLCKMLLWFLNMILNCLWNLFNKDKKGQQQAKKENIHYFSQLWVKCTNSKFYEKFKSQISRSLDSLQPLLAKWSTIYAKKAIKNLFLNKKYSKLMLRERQQETKKAIRLINSLKNFIWIRYKMCWVGTLKIRKTRLHGFRFAEVSLLFFFFFFICSSLSYFFFSFLCFQSCYCLFVFSLYVFHLFFFFHLGKAFQ